MEDIINWFYTLNNDIDFFIKKSKRTIDDMNRVKEKWNNSVKSELPLYDFLKKGIYKGQE